MLRAFVGNILAIKGIASILISIARPELYAGIHIATGLAIIAYIIWHIIFNTGRWGYYE